LKPGVVTGDAYAMLVEACQTGGYALPAVNMSSSHTINAGLEAAATHKADVMIQIFNGGAQFYAGRGFPDGEVAKVLGAVSAARHVRLMVKHDGICVILHTDHASQTFIPWVESMLDYGEAYFNKTGTPLFSSHMLDLSEESLAFNLDTCARIFFCLRPSLAGHYDTYYDIPPSIERHRMNDQERLGVVLDKLHSLNGLDKDQFQRLIAALDHNRTSVGYDEQGRLKIAFFDAKSYDIESFDRGNHHRHALHYIRAPLNRDTVYAAEGAKIVCIFVNDTCDAAVVEGLASLGVELIALRCAGFNNVDLKACQDHNMSVVRVPAYSPYAVAEHTVALMLMLNRRLHQAYQRNRAGYFVLDGLTGFDMHGKQVGVIGTGKIGQCTINILLGFGCRVLAFDKFPNAELAARDNVQYVDIEHLFGASDIITLHVPLFPETRHVINEAAIDQMKDGVMLINTSRGELVDTKALIGALKSGKIGSAGLDVYEEEAGVFFHNLSDQVLTDDVLARLMTFHNVVITSHQAFLTHEALTNIAETTLASIDEFKQGRRGAALTNVVHVQ
jgi:D-lactate dehydrogenase